MDTDMFKRLLAYKKENGHCNVPQRYPQDPQLGQWIKNQRQNYKNGKLMEERFDQLETIGFEFKRNREQWTKMLTRLQAYHKEHNGSCNVPKGYPQDPKLARWVNWQRYNYKKGLLTKERCDQLEEMGFEWKRKHEWIEMLERLQSYQQEHDGSSNVPRNFHLDPKLGNWVNCQRKCYKNGMLAKERYDQLEEIGFQWSGQRVGDDDDDDVVITADADFVV